MITKTPFIYGHNVTKRLDTRPTGGWEAKERGGGERGGGERLGGTEWSIVEQRKPVQCTTVRHNLIPKSLSRETRRRW